MLKDEKYRRLFSDFNSLNVLIIGDVMLDAYLWGKVERISPEAPIPIVTLKKKENRMGGAANVALNVKSLGARPILCTVIGADDKGDQFLDLIQKEYIENAGIIRSGERVTTTKFRIFGNSYQMLRVDDEIDHDLSPGEQEMLLERIRQLLRDSRIDCIIFQDYNKGVITPQVISEVVSMASDRNIPVTVDPKRKNFSSFRGVSLFKPNLKELKEGLKSDFDDTSHEHLARAARLLLDTMSCRYVMTTLSEKGVFITYMEDHEQRSIHVPAHMRAVADVSGAGDTVISVASLCLARRCSPYEIAFISNLAGGLVCEEVGVAPVDKNKLLKEVLSLI
jgi:rfaE bifunctional protein kinase chain/domain